jgi:hypothetical protein
MSFCKPTAKRLSVTALALLTIFMSSIAPPAAMPCAARSSVMNSLAQRYKEKPTAVGLVSGRLVMELYLSASGSWTLMTTTPEGMSCIVASGISWTPLKPKGPKA